MLTLYFVNNYDSIKILSGDYTLEYLQEYARKEIEKLRENDVWESWESWYIENEYGDILSYWRASEPW